MFLQLFQRGAEALIVQLLTLAGAQVAAHSLHVILQFAHEEL